MTSIRRLLATTALIATLSITNLAAQSTDDQLKEMRLEIQRLRGDLDAMRAELARLNPPKSDTAELTAEEAMPLVRAQLAEQAQSKVESTSKYSMKLFGSIVSNTFLNTGEPNWLDLGNVVVPTPAGLPAGSFSSSLRQSRVGAAIDGPAVGSMKTSGVIALDFFGGVPNFPTGQVMGLPRLLYAFMRLDGEKTAIEIGQDHAIFAPKNPTSLAGASFPLLFRSGNLYLRAPQLRAERLLASGSLGEVHLAAGILAPVAGDNDLSGYQFVPQNFAGERSRRPAVETRVSWRARPAGPYESPAWEIGTSNHYSRERYVAGLIPSWAEAFDFDGTVGRFGAGGEFFVGKNIDTFGGSIGQNAKSRGGFAEARFAATRQWDFNGGYGTDRLYDRLRFPGNLSGNSSIFANTIYRVTPEFAMSLEWRRLATKPSAAAMRRNNHFNLTFAYAF